ncbi:MAG: adenosine deaminase, partial [Oscillospiraceae bacterium]|nr:adenosine deaminase [Oscillospiraceae bacterium]
NGNVFGTIATGACLVDGAVATSYAHDHHNLLVLGGSNEDMALAANTVIDNCGGLAVVQNGKVIAQAQLEVCGLMSERDPYEVAKSIEDVEAAMCQIGYVHYNPVMSLATTCLPVSMDVKITDKGLVDVINGKIISIFND